MNEGVDVLIVGAKGGTNIGQSLYDGALARGLRSELLDTGLAMRGPRLLARLKWHLFDHRPLRLSWFSREVVRACERLRPRHLVSDGIAPLSRAAVVRLRRMNVQTINFLTDDPWNRAHRARWALRALREYARVVSPRRANLEDLRRLGCARVEYVPFGYDPRHCFPEPSDRALASDVIFVGGADRDRVPWIEALSQAGVHVALYGRYWERFAGTARLTRGQADPSVIRRATSAAKIALCLVRRANRDGHVMRSLEIPAIGACMLVEDTAEHRALFGADGECVVYFRSPSEMVSKVRQLLADERELQRLSAAVHRRIREGGHTYADRLGEILAH